MNAAAPAQLPKKNPATLGGTGGVIQLALDGIEPAPSKSYCSALLADEDPNVIRFARLLLKRPSGVECAAARQLGIGTHLPNQAKRLRDVYGIRISNQLISPNAKAEKYVLDAQEQERMKQLVAGV
jgi:hypothetical protein